jgi:tetratricopeptide (TPR) repeat protein
MTNKGKQKKTADTTAETAPEAAFDQDERSRVMCSIILDRLQKQDVVWIRIADPNARLVDDLQIATKTRIDAYLIRWSEWPDTLTLDDLVQESTAQASLMKQLADGWKRLKKQYRLPITVHLLSNDVPSSKKIDGAKKNDCHLARFLANEWKKNNQDDEDWADIWGKLRKASGLSEKQFEEFVAVCKFDCSYVRPKLDEDADSHQPYFWVEHIFDTLFEHEEHSKLPIELNNAELLQILGWRRENSQLAISLPKTALGRSPAAYGAFAVDGLPANGGLAQSIPTAGLAGEEAPSDGSVSEFERINEELALSDADMEQRYDQLESTTEPAWGEEFAAGESVGEQTFSSDIDAAADAVRHSNTPKPAASLSALRGKAAAGWLDAAGDSGSEVAEWLRTGTDTGPQALVSKETLRLRADDGSDSQAPAAFVGNKQGKEKKSWKDLAADQRQQSGSTRRFNEPGESRSTDADSQRTTGKLRQMLSSRVPEPDIADGDEDEDSNDGRPKYFGAPDDHQDANQEAIDGEAGSEITEPNAPGTDADGDIAAQNDSRTGTESASASHSDTDGDTDATNIELSDTHDITVDGSDDISARNKSDSDGAPDFSPQRSPGSDDKTASTESAPALAEDSFAKVSRLGREQEGLTVGDDSASIDAFNWYFNNGNDLFEASRFEDAALEYNRALELLNNLQGPNHDQEFLILQNLGDIYMFLDQPEQAVELYERTKQHHFTAKIPAAKYIAALIKLGTLHEDNNCFSDAEKEYRKAIEIAAEFLPKEDPILVRLNEACLNLARNRSTLMSRFSSTEVERIREMAKQEVDVAIMYRKKKTTETDTGSMDIWVGGKKVESDEEGPEPPSARSIWMAASGVIVVGFVFAYAMLVPHGGTSGVAVPAEALGEYVTADRQKTIQLDNGGRATYEYNGTSQQASYSLVGDNIQDLLPLIPGHLRSTFTFFRSTDDAIVDGSGIYFYSPNAAELRLVKQMWKYAELAQAYRHEKSFYPESDDAWSISKERLAFKNPITNSMDQGIIFSTTGESTDTPVRKSIAAGEAWANQPKPYPGQIICNVYNGRMFFIRGYDKNTQLLTSADKTKCFYIECSDGVDVTKDKLRDLHNKELLGTAAPAPNPVAPPAETRSDKKLRFVFASDPEVETRFQALLTGVPATLFFFALSAFAIWRYRANKKIAGPFSMAFAAITLVLLIAWYAVGILNTTG